MAKCSGSLSDQIAVNGPVQHRAVHRNADAWTPSLRVRSCIRTAVVDRIGVLAYVPLNAVAPMHSPRGGQGSTRKMFLFQFLLVVHFCVAAALVSVILVQKSEGGGLG